MTGQTVAERDSAEDLTEMHDPLASGFPPSLTGRFLFWLAVAFSLYQISIAAHVIDLPSQVMRAVHVGFLMALGFPMLAIGRGLVADPKLLLLDEPSLGLAPLLVRRVFDRLAVIRKESNLAIVLVEQNLAVTMRLCDELHFLRGGRIVGHRSAEALRDKTARQEAIDAFLGAAAA